MKTVSRAQIQDARRVDLLSYMEAKHPDLIRPAGVGRAILKEHDSCVFTRGLGYVWNSKNESGNGIDFLTKYLRYSFVEAVTALCEHGRVDTPPANVQSDLRDPEAIEGANRRLWGYLLGRGLTPETIKEILRSGAYETKDQHNIAFKSQYCHFIELCGTLSQRRFKGVQTGSDPDGYWYMGAGTPRTVYVCESAIDAASLYQIQNDQNAGYASMAGLKIGTLHRISRDFPDADVVLAVDNDQAANDFCAPLQTKRITPPQDAGKDWNDAIRYGAGKKEV